MADNRFAPKRTVNGNFSANPRVFAHDTVDLFNDSVEGSYTLGDQIPGTEAPNRGACLFCGVAVTDITVTLESGKTQVFKGIAAGSFLPILIKSLDAATPSPAAQGDYVALL